jgi:hypothetical protein
MLRRERERLKKRRSFRRNGMKKLNPTRSNTRRSGTASDLRIRSECEGEDRRLDDTLE